MLILAKVSRLKKSRWREPLPLSRFRIVDCLHLSDAGDAFEVFRSPLFGSDATLIVFGRFVR